MDSMSVKAVLSAVDKNYTSTLSKAIGLNDSLLGSMKRIAGGIGVYKIAATAIGAIKGSLDSAISRFDTLQNFPRVMQSLGFSASESEASIKKLGEGIDGLPTTLDGIAQSAQMLTASLGDLGKGTDTAVALNDMFLAGGQGAEAASRALTQYNQMLAKGKVDQQSWNTMVEVAPGQMAQLAHEMIGATATQKDLYDALQSGKIGMDEFNEAIIRLDTEGGEGFASFADQARAATGGIGTSLKNIKSAITKGVTSSIETINNMLANTKLGSISGILDNIKGKIKAAFEVINGVIASLEPVLQMLIPQLETIHHVFQEAFGAIKDALGTIDVNPIEMLRNAIARVSSVLRKVGFFIRDTIAPAFRILVGQVKITFHAFKEAFAAVKESFSGFGDGIDINPLEMLKTVITKVGQALRTAATFIRDHSDAIAKLIKPVLAVVGAFAGMKIISSITSKLSLFKKAADTAKGASGGLGSGLVKALASVPPTTILALGGALLMVAAGIALIATQSSGVVEILKGLGEAISIVLAGVANAINIAMPAIMALVPVLTEAFSQIIPVITDALSVILPLITDFAVAVLPIITDAIVQIVAIVTSAATQIIPMVTSYITELVSIVVDGIERIVIAATPIIEAIRDIISTVGDVIIAVVEQISPILDSLSELIQTTGDVICQVLDTVVAGFESFSESVSTILTAVSEVITSIGDSISSVLDSVAGIFDSIGNAALNAGTGVEKMASGVATLVGLKLMDLVASLTATADGLKAIGKTSGDVSSVASAINSLASSFSALRTGSTAASTAFSTMFSVLKLGITQAITSLQQFATIMTTSIRTAVATVRNTLNTIPTGAKAAMANAKSAIASGAAGIAAVVRTQYNAMYNAGRYIGQGLVNGLRSMLAAVQAAGNQMGNAASAGVAAAAKIGSPSKLMDKYGRWIGQGLINGMDAMSGKVYAAAGDMFGIGALYDGYGGELTLDRSIEGMGTLFSKLEQFLANPIVVDNSIMIDGREMAKGTTSYITTEMASQEKLASYIRGVK